MCKALDFQAFGFEIRGHFLGAPTKRPTPPCLWQLSCNSCKSAYILPFELELNSQFSEFMRWAEWVCYETPSPRRHVKLSCIDIDYWANYKKVSRPHRKWWFIQRVQTMENHVDKMENGTETWIILGFESFRVSHKLACFQVLTLFSHGQFFFMRLWAQEP